MINLNLPNISNKEIKSSSEALKAGWVSAGKYVELFFCFMVDWITFT